MRAALCLTMGFFRNRIEPLRELGYDYFSGAVSDGILSDDEAHRLRGLLYKTDCFESIPDEEEFRSIMAHQLQTIRSIAGI